MYTILFGILISSFSPVSESQELAAGSVQQEWQHITPLAKSVSCAVFRKRLLQELQREEEFINKLQEKKPKFDPVSLEKVRHLLQRSRTTFDLDQYLVRWVGVFVLPESQEFLNRSDTLLEVRSNLIYWPLSSHPTTQTFSVAKDSSKITVSVEMDYLQACLVDNHFELRFVSQQNEEFAFAHRVPEIGYLARGLLE